MLLVFDGSFKRKLIYEILLFKNKIIEFEKIYNKIIEESYGNILKKFPLII